MFSKIRHTIVGLAALAVLVGVAGQREARADKMYWVAAGNGKVQRADLDGSNVEDVVTGLSFPRAIALDLVSGKMYWTDFFTDGIHRANLDGSSVEALVTGLGDPAGIALDVAAGKMYWLDPAAGRKKLQRADLDGSNVEDVVTGLSNSQDIALSRGQ